MVDDERGACSDVDVIRRVLGGDVNRFRLLLAKYEETVTAIVKRHVPAGDVREVVQDVFVSAYRSLASFRQKGAFSHWLSSVAVKTCYAYWRKAYSSKEIPMTALTERHQAWLEGVLSETAEASVAARSSQREATEILDWALAKLSAEDRLVLELVYLEGHSVKEAARLLGWTVANVKVRSFRSRRKLAKILEGLRDA
jgi:RNA polymerase sigma-70 factor (ECF subfamily)